MFVCNRARPDINPAIGLLSSRVKVPNEGDWNKLLKTMVFLSGAVNDILQLEADATKSL